MRVLNTLATWGQSCSTVIRLSFFKCPRACVCWCKCIFSVCLWSSNKTWSSLNTECLFSYLDLTKTLLCVPLCCLCQTLLSSLKFAVRSWQRMRRADLRGSPSTPLSSFTRTWLTWMETCHRTTLTTSSAACRHKCKYCLCFESYRNEAYLITCIAISKSGCRRWKMKLFHMHYEWRRYPVSNSLIIFSHLNEFPLDSATDTS